MAEAGVDAFLVPRADAHQGENVAPRDERLAWLTGFTGSAGLAVVTGDRAAIFVDGRYRLQVQGQVDLDRFDDPRAPRGQARRLAGRGAARRRAARLRSLAAHRRRRSRRSAEALGAAADRPRRASRTSSTAVWPDQPPPPARPIVPHPVALAGRDSAEKRAELARGLVERDLAAAVLTLPDSIAWLLERPRLGHRPHPGAARLRHPARRRRGSTLFTDPAKCDDALRAHLGPEVARRAAGGLRPGARRAARPGRGRQGERAGLGLGPADGGGRPRWSGSATPASCPRPARPRPRSPAPAPRTCATARRWPSSSPGST